MDFPTGESPTSVAIADLNDDEVADLAVANHNFNDIAVPLGEITLVDRKADDAAFDSVADCAP